MFFGARRGSVVQLLLPVTTPYTASGRIVRSRRVKWMILLMSTMGLIVCGMKSSFHSSGRHKVARFQFDNHHVWQSTNNNSLPKPIVVLPATQTNPKFCRTLFSLLINGYNPPIIVSLHSERLFSLCSQK